MVWGVGSVLEKGGGMVRREWRPRVASAKAEQVEGPPRGGRAGREGEVQPEVASDKDVVSQTGEDPMDDEHEQRDWSPPPAGASSDEWVSLVRPPSPQAEPAPPDDSMNDLSSALQGVSLGMVPRSVLKARAKAKAAMLVEPAQ